MNIKKANPSDRDQLDMSAAIAARKKAYTNIHKAIADAIQTATESLTVL